MTRSIHSLLPHGAWLVAVAAAYGLGSMHSKSDRPLASASEGVSVRSESGTSLDLQRAGTTSDPEVPNEASGGEGIHSENITQDQITSLANDAVTAASPLARSLALSKLLESLSADNAMSIMSALEKNRATGDDWELFRYAWASVDPEGAMAHALSLEGRQQRDALEDTVTGWASKSPEDAKAWVDALEDKGDQERYRSRLVEGMADHDIGKATAYVMELAEQGDERAGRYLDSVTREQLRKGPVTEAARWAENLVDGKLKGQAMDSVAGRFVNENPEAAAAWAEKFASEDYAARVIEEVGDEWAERDPSASVAWLETLPEGKGQSEGMESAFGEWARRDPTAASAYLVDLADSPMKDAAVSGFARRIVREDPEAAMAWAGTIDQETMRVQTVANAAKEWFRRDREAASSWLESSNLSVDAREAILNSSKRR